MERAGYDEIVSLKRAIGLAASLCMLLGCEEDLLECPSGWEKDDEATPRCVPPAAHVADVEERLSNGFYGYANVLHFVPTDEDILLCEPRELARNAEFVVTERVPGAQISQFVQFTVKTDEEGLYEFETDATKEYSFSYVHGERPVGEIVLVGAHIGTNECPF